MEAEWRPVPVPEFSRAYLVSSSGEIARVLPSQGTKTGTIKQKINKRTGYCCVNLCAKGIAKTFTVHRLVCMAFHGEPPTDLHEVAHNDGVRTNNTSSNLRWATRAENSKDRLTHGTFLAGEKCPNAKLSSKDVLDIRAAVSAKERRAEIAKRFGVHVAYVNALARNEWRRHDHSMV